MACTRLSVAQPSSGAAPCRSLAAPPRALPAPRRRRCGRCGASRVTVATLSSAQRTEEGASELAYGAALVQGKRDEQEDAFTVLPTTVAGGYLYAAVFDGHGGSSAAHFLQRELHGALREALAQDALSSADTTLALAPALNAAFEGADEALLAHLGGDPAVPQLERLSGSTGTVALVRRERLVVANVGDSRCVLARARGRHLDVSPDHRPYGVGAAAKREVARVTAAGAWVADGRVMGVLAVSRAFGDSEFKAGRAQFLLDGTASGYWPASMAAGRVLTSPPVIATPDVSEVELLEGDDFLILASDGLWDCTSSAQSVAFVRAELARNGRDATLAAQALADNAVGKRRGQDNVAAIIVLLQ